MIGVFETIRIDNVEILRPNDMELKRADVYSGEYTTMNGSVIADRIGWKYADTTLKWDTLPDSMLTALTGLTGAVDFVFTDSDGTHTEKIIRGGFANTATRITAMDGNALWRDVAVDIRFINTHEDSEESSSS